MFKSLAQEHNMILSKTVYHYLLFKDNETKAQMVP